MEAEITLKHPVKSPDTGTPIERVSLREAKAGDLFAVAKLRDATQEERSLEFLAGLSRTCRAGQRRRAKFSVTELRRGYLILADATGWQPSEIDALDVSDFVNYLLLLKDSA